MGILKIYQIDAFTSEIFKGNPAAVCPLLEWLPDSVMQEIAAENNLSETAFYVPDSDGFHIRWFTPTVEVDLCGHATLAAAHVLFEHEKYPKDEIIFTCHVGKLFVLKSNGRIHLNFPSSPLEEVGIPTKLENALDKSPIAYFAKGKFGMAVFEKENDIAACTVDFLTLKEVNESIIIITAKADTVDFVSRVFGPKVGINEDPVTGAAHTRLIPYWSKKLNKKTLSALQLSQRGGQLFCEDKGERVIISGNAVTYLIGEIFI